MKRNSQSHCINFHINRSHAEAPCFSFYPAHPLLQLPGTGFFTLLQISVQGQVNDSALFLVNILSYVLILRLLLLKNGYDLQTPMWLGEGIPAVDRSLSNAPGPLHGARERSVDGDQEAPQDTEFQFFI